MDRILLIDTSTKVCSVALTANAEVISFKENYEDKSHASKLTIMIQEMLAEMGLTFEKIDAVAVSKGPGSYTGLRIGVSTAKGLCFAKNLPLISIDTLKIIANNTRQNHLIEGYLCPMIDARRMEVYMALYDGNLNEIMPVEAKVIDTQALEELVSSRKVFFCGNGASKCKELIRSDNAQFIEHIDPLARYMNELAYEKFLHKDFEEVAYFEPFYLKDFVATKPKNLLNPKN